MDPISAAVVAALAKLSEPAVKDAYEGLKRLIQRKFGTGGKLDRAVAELEETPASPARRAVLEEVVSTSQAAADDELLQAARGILHHMSEAGGAWAGGDGSIAIEGDVRGSTIIAGNHNRVGGEGPR